MNQTFAASLVLVLSALASGGCQMRSTPTSTRATSDASAPVAAADAKITEITFVKGVAKTGSKVEVSSKVSSKFTIEGKVYRETTESSATVDIQGADEFRVTKAAIDVKQLFTTKQDGTGDEKKSVNPLSGSRWIVTRNDDGKLSALDSSGGKVAAPQLAQLKENFDGIFQTDKSRDFLPKRAVKIGEKLTPAADAVLSLMGQKDDGTATVDGVEFILQSATKDRATFAVSLTLTLKIDPTIRLRTKLDGTIEVRPKDSEITSVALKGPLTLLDPKGNDKGTGDMSITATESSP